MLSRVSKGTSQKSHSMISALGCSDRRISLVRPSSSFVTSLALLSRMVLQNSICCMTRFSMSSSPMSCLVRSSPPSNSSFSLRASTTVTMLSSSAVPYSEYSSPICGIEQMVCAIGIGSHIPDASMTI